MLSRSVDKWRHDRRRLEYEHTPEGVKARLTEPPAPSYVRDFVYGAIDGAVTTFAIVAGAAGASLGSRIVLIMGLANLFADGFSMGVSNFLGSRAENEQRRLARLDEQRQVELFPEGEKEEVRQLFAAKGFEGEDLERAVSVITADRERWVDVMMSDELGFASNQGSPVRSAASTFVAFLVVGSVPLLPFLVNLVSSDLIAQPFLASAVLTGIAFCAVGVVKAVVIGQSWWRGGAETLALGGAAAAVAYVVGVALEGIG